MAEDVFTHSKTKTDSETENELIVSDGYIIDCITGEKLLKDTPKEQVQQFVAQSLKNRYRIKYDAM